MENSFFYHWLFYQSLFYFFSFQNLVKRKVFIYLLQNLPKIDIKIVIKQYNSFVWQ